jgi:D-glycero-D-manno-heptose 1,7-bisphosphate phosphatase|tara:strand:+ start:293 stop:907 length:615 start_codon:yes stop_codon:yes gene_type:complete
MVDIYWGEDPLSAPGYIAPKCVIGLDRDGVINVDRGTYTYKGTDFEPIEGSLDAVARLRKIGHKIAIITNQGGIGHGLFTEDDVDSLHQYMLDLLGEAGCPSIDAIYYSASSHKNDMYAKPNLGMFKRCQKEHPHIKFNKGYYVGDKLSDLKAAYKLGAKPVLVRTGYGLETEQQLNKFTYRDIKKKTIVFDDLSSFADWIEAH